MQLKLCKFILLLLIIIFCVFSGYDTTNYELDLSGENKLNKYNGYTISSSNKIKYDNSSITSISIPKIGLNRKLYDFNSNMNDVSKNIEVLKESSMPNVDGGNMILAAHNGYSSIAFFHNLYKLEIDDKVFINYNNKRYTYVISKIYDVMKTGNVTIKRDKNKTTLTMITCKGNDKQLVVIGYLE